MTMSSPASDLRQSTAREVVCLPASFAQQSLWFIDQLTPGRATYNIPAALRIRGELDVEILKRTLEEIVQRHETLRTRFVATRGEPQQVIEEQVDIELPVMDLTFISKEQKREAEAMRLGREEAQQPFNLKQAPLLRGKLLRLGARDHVLLFTMHHIISDGWSAGVLVEEVTVLYRAFSAGKPSPLPELPIQYADYSVWQQEWLGGGVLEEQLAYWKQQLAGVSMLQLPTDRPRPMFESQNGAPYDFVIDANVSQKLKKLAEEQSASLFMVLLAAFQTLFYRYSGQHDIAVGTPIAGRNSEETERLIGFFINTLVLRVDLSGRPTFTELLQRTKEVTLEAYAHQDVPFDKLVEALSPERSLGSTPLFQVMIVLQNAPQSDLRLGSAELRPFNVDNGTAKFDLLLLLGEEEPGTLTGSLQYNTDLFEAATVSRLFDHYRMLLSGIVADPSQPIAALPLLTANERAQVIEEWNRTEQEIAEGTVMELFEAQVQRSPEAVAAVFEDAELNYGELNRRANQLAHFLKQMGVMPEVPVGLCVDRNLDMVIALLGVLKAGGVCVPLDAHYSSQRLKWMLEEMQPPVLLTQSMIEKQLPPFAGTIIRLDKEWEEISRNSGANQPVNVTKENLMCAIYSSESTGKPKAVGIRHSSVVALLHWARKAFTAEELSGVLASTSISLDLSLYEIFAPLSWGGKVIVAGNMQELARMAAREEVKLVNAAPSAMQELLHNHGVPQSVVTVNLSREVLTTSLAEKVYEIKNIKRVFNLYGSSEAATYSTYSWIKDEEIDPEEKATARIGKPITNSQVYVVNEEIQPVPVGVAGEMCIGGAGLARGFLKQPDVTAERFVPNPYAGRNSAGGERLYRTGDLARWLPDGNLEYLGRQDEQVKIRGFRIDCSEIEAALQQHRSVRQAVVIAREDETGVKRLVAYVVPEQRDKEKENGSRRAGLQISELREHMLGKLMLGRLPEYMLPTAYVQLEESPLDHNGKIDRANLPQPDWYTPEQEYVGPRNPTEETLCRVWQEVLRRDRIGIHDNFFKIGGHSLLAAQVATRMRESFKVDIPLSRMFEASTIALLAETIDKAVQTAGASDAPSHLLPDIKPMARKAASLPVAFD
jgi:amino acid adenylation domain-containing protein